MSDELHAEVEAPIAHRRTLWVGVISGLVGTTAGVLACVLYLPQRIHTVVIASPPEKQIEVQQVPVVITPAAPPPVTDVELVITIGDETYIGLDTTAPTDVPKHGTPTLVQDGPIFASIAEVATKDLPDHLRAWKKRTVSIDGTCEAHVTGFAVIGRVRGDPSAAPGELTSWSAASVMEDGGPTLVARIEGCSGMFARDAALPAITVLTDMTDPGNIAERALERFVASRPVVDAQDGWREAGNDGDWYDGPDGHLETHVMRHPRTGVVWVVIHAYRYNDCGQVGGNVLGIYRVENDGSLATVQVRGGGMAQLAHVIDLEGDGELELVGSDGAETMIERTNGDSVRDLSVVLHGCGC